MNKTTATHLSPTRIYSPESILQEELLQKDSELRPSFYIYQKGRLKQYEIPDGEHIFKIGSGKSCHIVLEDSGISSEQLVVVRLGDSCYFMDCGSKDCTQFDGVKKRQAIVPVQSRLLIKVGGVTLIYLGINALDHPQWSDEEILQRALTVGRPLEAESEGELLLSNSLFGERSTNRVPILVGTHTTCDYRLEGPGIEPFHCVIYFSEKGAFLEDLTHGKPGISVDSLNCIGAKSINGDLTVKVGNVELFLYAYGNLKERSAAIFAGSGSQMNIVMTPLNSENHHQIVLSSGNRRLKVGRDDSCDIVIEDDSVSRLHAHIIVRDKCFFLADNQSSNKSFVNMEAVEKTSVRAGDVVEFGNVCYLVHYQ